MISDQNSVPAELERLAQAFEARDYKLAGVTVEKIVGHLRPTDPEPISAAQALADAPVSATAYSQSGWDELLKTARALADENWSLAALCLRKAIESARQQPIPAGVTLTNPDSLLVTEQELLRAVTSADHSTAASCVRRLTQNLAFL